MADTKVSALTNASAFDGTEEFHIVQGGNDRAASTAQMSAFSFFGGLYAPGNFTILTGKYAFMANVLKLVSTERGTLEGDSRLVII